MQRYYESRPIYKKDNVSHLNKTYTFIVLDGAGSVCFGTWGETYLQRRTDFS